MIFASSTATIGPHHVVFNRGIIATQALAHKLPKGESGAPSANALRKHIGEPGAKIRAKLPGQTTIWQGEAKHIQSGRRWTVDGLDQLFASIQRRVEGSEELE